MKSSSRLVYRQIKLSDSQSSYSFSFNQKIMENITGKALNKEEARERFKMQLKTNAENPLLGYFIAYHLNESLIGHAKITKYEDHIYELGYAILPEYWNNGYASEMLRALITHVELNLRPHALVGLVNPTNKASIKILENHGFRFERQKVHLEKLTAFYYLDYKN